MILRFVILFYYIIFQFLGLIVIFMVLVDVTWSQFKNSKFFRTEYLPPPADALGQSVYLSIIFTLVDSSSNSEISYSLRHILYLFSGILLNYWQTLCQGVFSLTTNHLKGDKHSLVYYILVCL